MGREAERGRVGERERSENGKFEFDGGESEERVKEEGVAVSSNMNDC